MIARVRFGYQDIVQALKLFVRFKEHHHVFKLAAAFCDLWALGIQRGSEG